MYIKLKLKIKKKRKVTKSVVVVANHLTDNFKWARSEQKRISLKKKNKKKVKKEKKALDRGPYLGR